jgi:hypothetical protein
MTFRRSSASPIWIYVRNFNYMYMRCSAYEIQTSTHWNLTGCNMTAWPPVIAQQYSSTTWVSLRFFKIIISCFYSCYVFKIAYLCNCITSNWVKSAVSLSSHFCLAWESIFRGDSPSELCRIMPILSFSAAHTFHIPTTGSKVTCGSDEFRYVVS